MKEPLLSKERVIFERRPELDFAKGICIIGMILVHCFEQVLFSWDTGFATSVVEYLGYPIGAPLFMICMGMTIMFSRRSDPKGLLIRGIALLIVGQVLNLIRYVLVYSISYAITGDIFFAMCIILVISSDIIPFAGLSFLMLALLTKIKLKPLAIFGVAILLNILGTLLTFVQTGIYPIDQVLGLLWPTATESYFPMFNWFIFVAAGYAYSYYYTRMNSLKRWYAIFLPIGLILTIAFYYISLTGDQAVFKIFDGAQGFSFIGLFDSIGCIIVAFTFIGIMWLIAQTGLKISPLVYVSKNINKYYCISWCYIVAISTVVTAGIVTVEDDLGTIVTAIVVLILTTLTVMFYKKYLEKKIAPWCTKHIVAIGIVVLVLTIVFMALGVYYVNCAMDMIDAEMIAEYELESYGYVLGDPLYPNMFNNYFGH